MPSLAQNCGVTTGEVSIIFSYRSLGVFCGAILTALIFPKFGKGKYPFPNETPSQKRLLSL
jgi:hypothetical protein